MKLIFFITTAIALFLSSAQASELKLSDDSNQNITVVRNYIPVGTPVSDAVKKMEAAGLRCTVERGKTATLHEGNVEVGQAGPMDFIWCDKQKRELWLGDGK